MSNILFPVLPSVVNASTTTLHPVLLERVRSSTPTRPYISILESIHNTHKSTPRRVACIEVTHLTGVVASYPIITTVHTYASSASSTLFPLTPSTADDNGEHYPPVFYSDSEEDKKPVDYSDIGPLYNNNLSGSASSSKIRPLYKYNDVSDYTGRINYFKVAPIHSDSDDASIASYAIGPLYLNSSLSSVSGEGNDADESDIEDMEVDWKLRPELLFEIYHAQRGLCLEVWS